MREHSNFYKAIAKIIVIYKYERHLREGGEELKSRPLYDVFEDFHRVMKRLSDEEQIVINQVKEKLIASLEKPEKKG